MKTNLRASICRVEVERDFITLVMDLHGQDDTGKLQTGSIRLVLPNTLPNAKIQIGRALDITITDDKES